MDSDVLIIRSSPYTMFPAQFKVIKQHFTGATFSLLEQPASIEKAKEFSSECKEIIAYPNPPAYHPFAPANFVKGYSDIVILYGNENGEGYLNLKILASRLSGRKIWSCNSATSLSMLSRTSIVWQFLFTPVVSVIKCALITFCIVSVCCIGVLRNVTPNILRKWRS